MGVWRAWTQQIKALVLWLPGHQWRALWRALALLTVGLAQAGRARLPVGAQRWPTRRWLAALLPFRFTPIG